MLLSSVDVVGETDRHFNRALKEARSRVYLSNIFTDISDTRAVEFESMSLAFAEKSLEKVLRESSPEDRMFIRLAIQRIHIEQFRCCEKLIQLKYLS